MRIINILSSKESNNQIVRTNTINAFLIKGGALAISFFSTPAFITYFNDNTVLGVWYTMLSLLSWFLNFDLGLGNGIRNQLTKAFAEHDKSGAKYIISSGFFSVGIVTCILTFAGTMLISFVDWNSVFNVSTALISAVDIRKSAMLVFYALMLRFFLTTVSSVFYAIQRSSFNNFLGLLVSILQYLFVSHIHIDDSSQALITLSIAYMVISNSPLVVAGLYIFATDLRDCRPCVRYINPSYIRSVMKLGGVFFLCQLLYMVIVNTNELLISNLFDPRFTTEYTFYFKITGLIGTMVTLAMTPIWSVVTKAMAEGHWKWINKLYQRIKLIGLGIACIEFLSIIFLQPVMDIWLRESSFTVQPRIAIAFACFGSVFVYSNMLSTIVCGMARMKLQAICYGAGAVFKLLFVYFMSQYSQNWSIVVWSNTFLLIPYCILQHIDLNCYIKKKIKG